MTQDHPNRSLEEIVDECLDEIAAGRLSVEGALARWPDQRDDLAPLLDVAIAMRELPPVAERAPDPDRRAGFMAAIATTPQEAPLASPTEHRGVNKRIGGWFAGFAGVAPRIAAVAGPAAAVALVAVFFVLSSGADRASASTLTVFDGAVERLEDGEWLPVSDGASVDEGAHLRTSISGVALLTFPDGSTAALDPLTELILKTIAIGDTRRITLEQLDGRIWNDVAPRISGDVVYTVRTPDAVIEAHGTTFETAVRYGETSVITASGEVEVAAGRDRRLSEAGLVVRANDAQILDSKPHASTNVPATLRVDGPFVSSIQAENGAATGALPSGVTYQQIPGISSTDPGDGPQLLRFYDVAAGRYTLVLRRIDGVRSDGQATLEANGRQRVVELPADLETLRIQIDIRVDGGIVSLALVDREATSVEPPVRDERIVDSPRSSDAVPVSDQRAATQPTAEPTRPAATETPQRPSPTASDAAPTATSTPGRDRLGIEPTADRGTATATPAPSDRPTATATATPSDGTSRDAR